VHVGSIGYTRSMNEIEMALNPSDTEFLLWEQAQARKPRRVCAGDWSIGTRDPFENTEVDTPSPF
jgi:hypothetical protein